MSQVQSYTVIRCRNCALLLPRPLFAHVCGNFFEKSQDEGFCDDIDIEDHDAFMSTLNRDLAQGVKVYLRIGHKLISLKYPISH